MKQSARKILISILIAILILCLLAIIIVGILFAPKKDDPSGTLPDGTEQGPADDGDEDGDCEKISGLEFVYTDEEGLEDSYIVVGIGTESGDIVIPSTHEGLAVSAIGEGAFKDCTNVTSVVIPDSVVRIGWRPFDGCTNLRSITIGSGMKEGYGVKTAHEWQDSGEGEAFAFGVCPALTNLEISPNNEKYYAEGVCIIEKATKILVVGFENSVIPNDVTAIGEYAFLRQTGLQTIEIPSSVKAIGDQAFQSSGLEQINIPESVTFIGTQAFFGSQLSRISIPDSVTSLGLLAFWNCENLTTASLPNGLTTITNGLFHGCKKLERVHIPVSVNKIEAFAFGAVNQTDGVKEYQLTITFEYGGNENQWNAIEKNDLWDDAIGTCHLVCSN